MPYAHGGEVEVLVSRLVAVRWGCHASSNDHSTKNQRTLKGQTKYASLQLFIFRTFSPAIQHFYKPLIHHYTYFHKHYGFVQTLSIIYLLNLLLLLLFFYFICFKLFDFLKTVCMFTLWWPCTWCPSSLCTTKLTTFSADTALYYYNKYKCQQTINRF